MFDYNIMTGIPGSGKSYIVKQLYKKYKNNGKRCVIICPDTIRKKLTGDEMNQSRNREVFQIAERLVRRALSRKINVIFDATNVNPRARKSALSYANDLENPEECHKRSIEVVCPLDIAKIRNNNRPETHRVPDDVIESFYLRYTSPSLDEGFDTLIRYNNSRNAEIENDVIEEEKDGR